MAQFSRDAHGSWLLGKTRVSLERTCVRLKVDTEDGTGRLVPALSTFRLRRIDSAVVVSPHAANPTPGTYVRRTPLPVGKPNEELSFPLTSEWEFVEYL